MVIVFVVSATGARFLSLLGLHPLFLLRRDTPFRLRSFRSPRHAFLQLAGLQLAIGSLRKNHVRFTPESGHVQRTRPCLLWAISGH